MKKSLLLKESRGSIVSALDKAIDNGYKVRLSYYNEGSGGIITRSLYIFSRGITSRGKMCYRAFQYSPESGEMGYQSTKNHGWRLFDVENIVDFTILNKQSKLWIKGEIPQWLSKLNVKNDKMFPNGTLKYMDLSLFMDKHRGNASVKNRRSKIDSDNLNNTIDNPEASDDPQLSLFNEPVNNVKPTRSYSKRRPKQDFSNQEELDFSDQEPQENEPEPLNKPTPEIESIPNNSEELPLEEPEVENNRDKGVENIKETIKKRDLLKWKGKDHYQKF